MGVFGFVFFFLAMENIVKSVIYYYFLSVRGDTCSFLIEKQLFLSFLLCVMFHSNVLSLPSSAFSLCHM